LYIYVLLFVLLPFPFVEWVVLIWKLTNIVFIPNFLKKCSTLNVGSQFQASKYV